MVRGHDTVEIDAEQRLRPRVVVVIVDVLSRHFFFKFYARKYL